MQKATRVLLEINTLPGLTPDYSDLCLQANAEGMAYNDLILEILYMGASRWGMLEPREVPWKRENADEKPITWHSDLPGYAHACSKRVRNFFKKHTYRIT